MGPNHILRGMFWPNLTNFCDISNFLDFQVGPHCALLPDRSVLIGQKLVENAKIKKLKCDILSNFQTMWARFARYEWRQSKCSSKSPYPIMYAGWGLSSSLQSVYALVFSLFLCRNLIRFLSSSKEYVFCYLRKSLLTKFSAPPLVTNTFFLGMKSRVRISLAVKDTFVCHIKRQKEVISNLSKLGK